MRPWLIIVEPSPSLSHDSCRPIDGRRNLAMRFLHSEKIRIHSNELRHSLSLQVQLLDGRRLVDQSLVSQIILNE